MANIFLFYFKTTILRDSLKLHSDSTVDIVEYLFEFSINKIGYCISLLLFHDILRPIFLLLNLSQL